MTSKICLDCGDPFEVARYTGAPSRCPDCTAERPRTHNWETRPKGRELDSAAYRKFRDRAVRAWVRTHGWVCPGVGVPAHASTDLQLDHLERRADGGSVITGPGGYRVICGSCNIRASNAKGRRRPDPPGGNPW